MGNFHHHKKDGRKKKLKQNNKKIKVVSLQYKHFLPLIIHFPQRFSQMFGFYLKAEVETQVSKYAFSYWVSLGSFSLEWFLSLSFITLTFGKSTFY